MGGLCCLPKQLKKDPQNEPGPKSAENNYTIPVELQENAPDRVGNDFDSMTEQQQIDLGKPLS